MTLPIAPGTYGIDQVHTQLGFSVDHLGISLVRGTFADFTGELIVGENLVDTAVTVTASMASVMSGNAARDDVLRSEDWFDVANHPEMTFASTAVTDVGDGYEMTGGLTIRGVTERVTFLAAYNGEAVFPVDQSTHFGFSARSRINRSDFGISLGAPVIADEIDLLLEAQFVRPAQ